MIVGPVGCIDGCQLRRGWGWQPPTLHSKGATILRSMSKVICNFTPSCEPLLAANAPEVNLPGRI